MSVRFLLDYRIFLPS